MKRIGIMGLIESVARRLSCWMFGHGPVWFDVRDLSDGLCGRCCGICGTVLPKEDVRG